MFFTWDRILGRNPDKSLKSFPLSKSLPQLCLEIYISSNSFKLFQFLQFILHTVKEKGGKPDRKPYPLPYALRNPYRNLKSRNSQRNLNEISTKLCLDEFGFCSNIMWYIPFCHLAEMSGGKVLVPLYQIVYFCYVNIWFLLLHIWYIPDSKHWISIHFSVLFMYHIPALYTAYTIYAIFLLCIMYMSYSCSVYMSYSCSVNMPYSLSVYMSYSALYICPIPALNICHMSYSCSVDMSYSLSVHMSYSCSVYILYSCSAYICSVPALISYSCSVNIPRWEVERPQLAGLRCNSNHYG